MADTAPNRSPTLERAFALREQGRLAEAAALCGAELADRPEQPGVLHLLGVLEGQRGRLREAVECLDRAAALAPTAPSVFCNLAKFLLDAGRPEDAVSAARTAVGLKADYAEANSNLAAALNVLSRYDEAAAAANAAIQLAPELGAAHHNFGNAQRGLGRVDLAVAAYRAALSIRPGAIEVQHEFLNTIRYDPAFSAVEILGETRRWYDEQAAGLMRAHRPHPNDRSPERRLRVGYVSPDLRDHPVGLNLLPLFRSHSHDAVEVVSYAGVDTPDAITAEFRARSDVWRTTVGLSHAQLARQVREDAIDILVDLSLHTVGNRLFAFALKPAPVQVTFAGYPGTTGMRAIDYRLTDPYLDPPGETESLYVERSIRLPRTFWCIEPAADDIPVSALPADASGQVTFGCLNDFAKTNDRVLTIWAAVLRAVGGSRLLLACPDGSPRSRVLAHLAGEGIAADRVSFCGRRSRPEYLRTYHAIDIVLDTVPYNGHTTSLDAFWMGVPVVTLVGDTVVGRAGLSQAFNLGLPELVARTPSQFVEVACGLARDRRALSVLRSSMRDRMRRSPLMDGPAFAGAIEQAYRAMWTRWCGGTSNASTDGSTSGSSIRSNS